ncbi:hypothetical protein BDP55DRAFT_774293 [Colletotrichum godetiae]|uniref:Uncharacterized protein n=1 Tax=Colletotrichum godetiae TaxID=1209918 RepID=A0AAJ0A5T2_9PEZI|nr:uncharacterized protein BDP55DRAFT_774293 [Colletotrichum godetiae]KAK1657027.1 hypothetical protein BDP55DRAFT_774293 [Colletotrichum godetiae]
MPPDAYEDLVSTIKQHFSGPVGIESGCDFIASSASEVTEFTMYVSDGNLGKAAEIYTSINPHFAFDFIQRRLSLSSVHCLAVSGEIKPVDGTAPVQENIRRESELLQIQEAKVSTILLQTQGIVVDDIAKKIDKLMKGDVDKDRGHFLKDIFEDIDNLQLLHGSLK